MEKRALLVRSEGVHELDAEIWSNRVRIRVQELCELDGSSCQNLQMFNRALDAASLAATTSAERSWNENKRGFAMATDECYSRWEQRN